MSNDIPQEIRDYAESITPVGSRVTCDPPPMGTDRDFLVLTGDFDTMRSIIERHGFVLDGEERYLEMDRSEFNSFRLGDINLIVTDDESFHSRFLEASAIAKRRNLLSKDDRIALFQAVLYGNGSVSEEAA